MLRTRNLTPEIYNKGSRDFQLLGSLYDAVFNNIRTNIECMNLLSLPENIDSNYLELLSLTLGFNSKHTYDNKTLAAVCSSFNYLLKNKGSLKAIEDSIKILLSAQYYEPNYSIKVNKEDKSIQIFLTKGLTDTIFLEDIMDYILPAGWVFSIICQLDLESTEQKTNLIVDDMIEVTENIDPNLPQINNSENDSVDIAEIIISR